MDTEAATTATPEQAQSPGLAESDGERHARPSDGPNGASGRASELVPRSGRDAAAGAASAGAGGPSARDGFDLSAFEGLDRPVNKNGNARPTLRTRALKTLDYGLCTVAGGLYDGIHFFASNRTRPSFTPKWSDKPLLKSWEKSKPRLGWPRETDSLCPQCVIEARRRILDGDQDYTTLIHDKVGEVKARIIERGGEVWMIKDCPEHGRFEDIMAMDARFLEWIEKNYPGRDIRAHNDQQLHKHGSSTIRYGRGSVLTVDLTNRCNMMCDPCFMDANQVGFVHELEWQEIKEILDNSLQIKPRRQMSVQFSGGEPTLSPHFLRAVRYARDIGYNSVQAATNGIEFAKSFEYTKQAADAGLRFAYLQFDGIGNEANSHRKIGNLFDVKLKAIDNLYNAGVQVVLVTTLVNNLNNDQVGPIIRFALDNPKKIAFIAFQPVSFTGRDEEITEERRLRQRYTLSHMAHDVKKQIGLTEPTRDWFPISAFQPFADFADLVHGPAAEWGQTSCGCHPNCGVGTALLVNKNTKEFAPVPEFLDVPQLFEDTKKITDLGRGKGFSNFMMALALLKNYKAFKTPPTLTLLDILKKFDKTFSLTGRDYGSVTPDGAWERRKDPWNFLFVAGMWFQDLFNYDFRRTEMCIIPYATQEGEISFCAYNTGHGWRQIIEHMHKNATVAEWFREHGKHEVFAGGKDVPLSDTSHSLVVNEQDANKQRILAEGVAHTASEEKALKRRLAREGAKAGNGNGGNGHHAHGNGGNGGNGHAAHDHGGNGNSQGDQSLEEKAAKVRDDARIAAVARDYYEQMVLKRAKPSQGQMVKFDLTSKKG